MGLKSRGRNPTGMSVDEEQETEVVRRIRHEPTEIRIYIKALKRALNYLPIGSRAYHYVQGELTRATKILKVTLPFAPPSKSTTSRDSPR